MTKSIFSLSIEKQYFQKSRFENILCTYLFTPDAALPQVFDKAKDHKIIRKDVKDFWNSVLDLLAYSKCPIK